MLHAAYFRYCTKIAYDPNFPFWSILNLTVAPSLHLMQVSHHQGQSEKAWEHMRLVHLKTRTKDGFDVV